MSTIEAQIAEEWPMAYANLGAVHGRFPTLTIGEVIHLAARIGGADDAWDAGPGAVTCGLTVMLDQEPGGAWRPCSTGATYILDGKAFVFGPLRCT